MFTTKMSRSPHPGETHPPVPPTTPIFDAFAYLCVPRRQDRTYSARHARLQHRPAPPVRDRPSGPDPRHRLRRTIRVRDRCELARGGVGRHRARLRQPWPPRRRVHRSDASCSGREDEVSYHGEFFDFEGAIFLPKPVQSPWPPISGRRGERGRVAAGGAPVRRLDRHEPRLRVGRPGDRPPEGAARRARPRPVGLPDLPGRRDHQPRRRATAGKSSALPESCSRRGQARGKRSTGCAASPARSASTDQDRIWTLSVAQASRAVQIGVRPA